MRRSTFVARSGMIAALYAAVTVMSIVILQGLAWGPVQFRISEALTVLAVLTPAAVPGLTIGCLVANMISLSITGAGLFGLLDVVFGTVATLLGALWARKFRSRTTVALLGPVIFNALIVAAYLPVILRGFGFYTIPFTAISVENAYGLMYLFGVVSVGIGQAVVVYGLGLPLLSLLKRLGLGVDDTAPAAPKR